MNPAGKLSSITAGMAAGADCIDDLDVIGSGGMEQLFGGVYACSTLGQFLREFTHGHARQLASVARAHLVNLVQNSGLLPGLASRAYVDIDSLLRPVYGQQKQGASYGHTKIAGRQILGKGLSPLATTISTADGAPVIAGIRLRAGRAGSGKGAASMVVEAINTARAAGASEILARGDSAYAQQRRHQRLHQGPCPVFLRADQERDREPGHRQHHRRRLDTGALPRRRGRSRHR